MYTSVLQLFIYSLQIFGYDSLWYNCSIVIIFYFPCISLFYSFVCSSHWCILSYMHVPYGAFFINKEFEFEFIKIYFIYCENITLYFFLYSIQFYALILNTNIILCRHNKATAATF